MEELRTIAELLKSVVSAMVDSLQQVNSLPRCFRRAYPVNAHGQPGFLLQEAEHSARS
jgi:hypothetical protein